MTVLLSRPPRYILASVAVSLGGFLNGFDTGAVGAVTSMTQFTASLGPLSPTMVGVTVSLIMLAGTPPAVVAGWLADVHGRLRLITLGALLFAAGALLQATAGRLAPFLLGRTLAGLGEGVYLGTMSVYISEIAPTARRGVLAGLPQTMATAGVCVGYFTCYAASNVGSSMAWRFPFVVMAVLAGVLVVVACWLLPESPRWLLSCRGDHAGAREALRRLDFSMAEAEREFLGPREGALGSGATATAATSEPRTGLSFGQSLVILFRRGYRSRTILALFVLGMVQLSGIDGVLYYAPYLFAQAGLSSETASFLASGLSAILMLAVSIPAFLLSDRWGRRTSAIVGGVGLSGCMFLMGTLYAAGAVHPYGVARWVVIVAVFLFGITYCATWGIVGKIYASEIQPQHVRAGANCLAQGLGFFTNWLVAMLTPILLAKSAFGAYFLFGSLALFTVAVLGACMPETRGRSLEDIQQAFHHQRPAWPSLLASWLRTKIGGGGRRRGARVPGESTRAGGEEGHVELRSAAAVVRGSA